MRTLRFRFAGYIKDRVMRFYGVPFSPFQLEPALVPFLPRGKPITLVDVGASVGGFAAAVRDHCGIRRALLIEPQPANARVLAAQYADSRFQISECAVSDEEGAVDMAILNFHYSSSLLAVKAEFAGNSPDADFRVRERIAVKTRLLDNLLAEISWTEPVDLLKIDVQGAEIKALNGARQTLARTRMAWIEVSFRPMYEGSAVFADVHAFMNSHGFRLSSIQEGFRGEQGELLQADALFCSGIRGGG